MDNATKAIMIGVGLFITVIIISAVLVVVNLGTGAMDNATGQMNGLLDNLTALSDLEGRTDLSKAEVELIVKRAKAGTFNYAVTVLWSETVGEGAAAVTSDKNYVVPSRNGGYALGAVTSTVARNELAAKYNNQYMTFTSGAVGTTGNFAPKDTTYSCSVIEDTFGTELGLFIYAN